MKKLWYKFNRFVNQNIGRKVTFLMAPIICVIMAVTIMLVNHMYTQRFIDNIEEGSQYMTDTFKMNMDFCTTDVKSLLNTLSLNDNVITLVTMDEEAIDYGKLLNSEREMKKLLGSMTSVKSYVQDVFVVGENGYQYNYLGYSRGNIMETEWFRQGVDKESKGFQYILPHGADYYETGKSPSSQVISIVLPIKYNGKEVVGYAVCDIRMDKAAVLSDGMNENTNMRAYLVNETTKEYYDFQTKEKQSGGDEPFINAIGDRKSDFLIADHDFIVYSRMESSDWYIAVVHMYKDIIASAVTAQRIGFVMLLISCCLIVVVAHIISGFVKRPINDIISRIQQVEQQNFQPVEVTHTQNQPGEIVLIRNRFEEMIDQINELVHKVYLDEIYQKNMEYENLVNQVNPHFIYNVLQLIQSKAVLSENYEIDDIVVALSRLMRYTMSNRNKIVTIKEECSYIESFLDLYEQRYSHKFSYKINIDKELELHPILKFALQPVAENCIKHGFKNLKREGHVVIDVYRDKDSVYFVVEDDGNGIAADRLEEIYHHISNTDDGQLDSIGLRNTYQRLKLTYADKAGMKIESVEHQYTRVCCWIPYEEGQNV